MQKNIKKPMMQNVQERLYFEYQEWKNTFIGCFVLNLLAYGFYITHITYSADDYSYITKRLHIITSGRWLADFIYNVIFQSNYMPTLAGLIAIACYIFTGIGLCRLWEIKNKKTCLLLISLWSFHPYLLDTYNFRIAAVNLAVVYMIAVAALLVMSRGRTGFILSVILFYLALSIYQAVISFTISVIMLMALFQGVRERFSLTAICASARRVGSCLVKLVISVVLYFVMTKLIFVVLDLQAGSRFEAGFISTFDQLWVKISWLMLTLAVRILPIQEYVFPFIGKVMIFMILILGIVSVLRKTSLWTTAVFVFLWMLLIPLAAVSFTIPLVTSDLPWRVCMGLVVFSVGMFAITQESNSIYFRRIGFVSGVFLVGYFILNSNAIFYKQYLVNQKDIAMGNQLIARIQSLEGYQPGMILAVVGTRDTESFTKEGKGYRQIVKEYIKHCSTRRYSLTRSAFETEWSKYTFLLDYLDLELKWSSPEKENLARILSAGRKPWPDPSSVFIEEEMVIVVLSCQ